MDQTLQTLVDKQAIYELSCRYMRGLDRTDAELLLSVFWDDAYCEYGFINGDAPTFIVFAVTALTRARIEPAHDRLIHCLKSKETRPSARCIFRPITR